MEFKEVVTGTVENYGRFVKSWGNMIIGYSKQIMTTTCYKSIVGRINFQFRLVLLSNNVGIIMKLL